MDLIADRKCPLLPGKEEQKRLHEGITGITGITLTGEFPLYSTLLSFLQSVLNYCLTFQIQVRGCFVQEQNRRIANLK